MAQQRAADPEGEVATARAVRGRGTLLGVSTNTGVRFADIAEVGAPWWFQVYVMDDRAITADVVQRAARAGATAMILTVDAPAVDPRRPQLEPRTWPERYGHFLTQIRPFPDAEHPSGQQHSTEKINLSMNTRRIYLSTT